MYLCISRPRLGSSGQSFFHLPTASVGRDLRTLRIETGKQDYQTAVRFHLGEETGLHLRRSVPDLAHSFGNQFLNQVLQIVYRQLWRCQWA